MIVRIITQDVIRPITDLIYLGIKTIGEFFSYIIPETKKIEIIRAKGAYHDVRLYYYPNKEICKLQILEDNYSASQGINKMLLVESLMNKLISENPELTEPDLILKLREIANKE